MMFPDFSTASAVRFTMEQKMNHDDPQDTGFNRNEGCRGKTDAGQSRMEGSRLTGFTRLNRIFHRILQPGTAH